MASSDVSTSRLRVLLAVLDTGSFTAAAGTLHLTQQAVSAAVARLEEDLGVRLLERRPHGHVPTAAGTLLADEARGLLASWDEAVQAAQRQDRSEKGLLRVGAMAGAALELTDPILQAFAELEPDTAVEVGPHLYDDPTAGLADGQTDVAFLRPPLSAEGLVLTPLLVEPRVVLVGSAHALASRTQVSVDELRTHPAARPASPDETWNAFWSANAPTDNAVPVTTLEMALEVVATGRAWAIAPVGWTRTFQRAGLQVLLAPDLPPSVLAIARRHGERNPLVHRFVETAVRLATEQRDLVPAASAPGHVPAPR